MYHCTEKAVEQKCPGAVGATTHAAGRNGAQGQQEKSSIFLPMPWRNMKLPRYVQKRPRSAGLSWRLPQTTKARGRLIRLSTSLLSIRTDWLSTDLTHLTDLPIMSWLFVQMEKSTISPLMKATTMPCALFQLSKILSPVILAR